MCNLFITRAFYKIQAYFSTRKLDKKYNKLIILDILPGGKETNMAHLKVVLYGITAREGDVESLRKFLKRNSGEKVEVVICRKGNLGDFLEEAEKQNATLLAQVSWRAELVDKLHAMGYVLLYQECIHANREWRMIHYPEMEIMPYAGNS